MRVLKTVFISNTITKKEAELFKTQLAN